MRLDPEAWTKDPLEASGEDPGERKAGGICMSSAQTSLGTPQQLKERMSTTSDTPAGKATAPRVAC